MHAQPACAQVWRATATKARCSSSMVSVSHHGRTAVALSTQRCRMANPPGGRANQRPRVASRCIIAVFLQSRVPVESVSCASGKLQPGCFLRCSTRSKQRVPRLCACPSGVPYAGIPHGAMGVTGRAAALNRRPRRVGRWLAVLWWCGRDGVAFCDVAVPPSRQRRRRATGAGERGNIVISHTTQQHGVVGGRDISKHPLNGSSGPGTGSASGGQLSRLSIGRIGVQIPGGVGSLKGNRGLRCAQQAAVCLAGVLSNETRPPDSALAAAHCAPRDGRCPPTIRSGPPEAATARPCDVSCGLGEGGWATIDRLRSQPRRRCSSSRLCRLRRHGQAQLLANKFSALIYAKPPLYHESLGVHASAGVAACMDAGVVVGPRWRRSTAPRLEQRIPRGPPPCLRIASFFASSAR
jgi:hypothetical protein